MEKKRITIICIIIYLLIGVVFIRAGYSSYKGSRIPKKDRTEEEKKMDNELHMFSMDLSITPTEWKEYPHSVTNIKGEYPINYRINEVEARINTSKTYLLITGLLILPLFALMLYAIFGFVSFIRNIKRGNIFTRSTVTKMRMIAFAFLLIAVFQNVYKFSNYLMAKDQFQLTGYNVSMPKIALSYIWVFLVFILFAEIFALGTRMKEEQELTI